MYRTIVSLFLVGICGLLPIATFADVVVVNTEPTGGGSYHTNIQPGLGLYHIIALQGMYPSRNKDVKGSETVLGEVSLFAGDFAPRSWAFCDGQLLQISQYSALFSILGTTYGGDGRTTFALPDLRGRTVVHEGNGPGLTPRPLGQKFGVGDVTLTAAQMPQHNHTLPAVGYAEDETSNTGGSQQHTNMQPSLVLNHTIALQGLFPSRNKGIADPYIGEVGLFAGNFAPRGWAFTDGQLMSISQNEALFSILGTTYGGDGRTTFGLPDLRGRAAMGPRTGPGLTPRTLGQKIGVENVTLTTAQMPSHNHELWTGLGHPANDDTGDTGGGQSHDNMQPSMALNYIIAMQGTYPSRYKDGVEPAEDKSYEPFLGEVNLFAGNFAPRGWAYCDGQILQISQHDALFSLLGTRYGGDGRTTFGLPDLRGRVPVHPGSGPGLMPWQWGQKYGGEDSSLSVGQLPAHIHTANVPEPSTLVLGASALLALALIGWRRRRQS